MKAYQMALATMVLVPIVIVAVGSMLWHLPAILWEARW
jgi:hypothetical protein